jgi:hypothetical protein
MRRRLRSGGESGFGPQRQCRLQAHQQRPECIPVKLEVILCPIFAIEK